MSGERQWSPRSRRTEGELQLTTTLTQLAYVSRATTTFPEDDLVELMRAARQKNKRLGITGMLLFDEPLFLQVLEGPRHVVEDLLETIRRDERHEEVTVIFQDHDLPEREYARWLMGSKILGSGLPADYAELDERVKRVLRVASTDGELAGELQQAFRRIEAEYFEI